jgi:endonuclease/exonuclease/phosphatase (EEP) superfamily protein YafD
VRRALTVVIGILCLGVAGGLLDGIVWPGAPLALFRPQLTLLLLGVACVALVTGPRRPAMLGLVGAGLGASLLIPAARDPAPEHPAGETAVRLLTVNLWHRNDDASAVASLIRRERPDVVALIELTPAWERALAVVLEEYRVRAREPRSGATGIGLYGNALLREPRVVRLTDPDWPAVEATLDLPGGSARLLVAHPPGSILPGVAAVHARELEAIGRWAREYGPRAVVCGDLNAAPWSRSLRGALEEGSLRAALPGGFFAGSWPALVPPFRLAIDGCLVGRDVRARARLGPRVGSDHLPVLVELG